MKSAIEQIFDGELADQNPDKGKEYREANETAIKKERALRELIKDNAEAVKAFEEFEKADGEISGLEAIRYYKQGFRNGFRIAIDGLDED